MKLTPQEISTQQFKIRGKGFDKEEVTGFLMQVAERLENESFEKDRLKKIVGKLNEVLFKYEKRSFF